MVEDDLFHTLAVIPPPSTAQLRVEGCNVEQDARLLKAKARRSGGLKDGDGAWKRGAGSVWRCEEDRINESFRDLRQRSSARSDRRGSG